VNNLIKILIFFIFFSGCSFNSDSKFWSKSKKIKNNQRSIVNELFKPEEARKLEFNSNFYLKVSRKSINNKFTNNQNNHGRTNYIGNLKGISKYKFSTIKFFYEFEPELIFDNNDLIFFDNNGAILKFDKSSKLIWKKNHYIKSEKKLTPLLHMASNENILVIADSISKYYALDIISGELLWSKNNDAAFISEVKIQKDKFFVIDSNNVLRCFSLKDGSQIWEYKSENRVIKSQKKLSIAIINNIVVFNNSVGDINALDIASGDLLWIAPTASGESIAESFLLRISDLVIKDNIVFFSTNKNEFYALSANTGIELWKQKINSDLRPIIVDNLVFTISLEGFLFILEKDTGNIIRITDIFNGFKFKKRKKIKPIGFMIGLNEIFLSTSNGRLIIIDIITGKIKSILKIDNQKISRPFISNNNLFVVKNNSIIKLN